MVLTSQEAETLLEEKENMVKEKEEKAKLAAQKEAEKSLSKDGAKGPKTKKDKKDNVSDSSSENEDDKEDGKAKPWDDVAGENSNEARARTESYDHSKVLEKMEEIRVAMDDHHTGSFFAVYFADEFYWGRVEMVEAPEPKDSCNKVC